MVYCIWYTVSIPKQPYTTKTLVHTVYLDIGESPIPSQAIPWDTT